MAELGSNNTKIKPSVSKISMFFSAICMGNVGLILSFLSGYPIHTLVLLRGIFGNLFLTIIMIFIKSFSREFLKESFRLIWKPLIISGMVYPLVIFFYFMCITISGYAIAAFLLYTNGLFLLILLFLTKEEKISKINVFSVFLALIGVSIIMEFWDNNLFSPGIITGLLSGLTLSIHIFYRKKIYNKRYKLNNKLQAKGNFDIFLSWWSTLLLILVFLPFGATDLLKLSINDILFSLLLGLIPTALAFTLYNVGIKNDKGGNIVILLYFEPVMAMINTAIFLQNLSIFIIIGGILILMANVIVLRYSK